MGGPYIGQEPDTSDIFDMGSDISDPADMSEYLRQILT
jgi:hypothetical protein